MYVNTGQLLLVLGPWCIYVRRPTRLSIVLYVRYRDSVMPSKSLNPTVSKGVVLHVFPLRPWSLITHGILSLCCGPLNVNIGLDEASCPEAAGPRQGRTTALSVSSVNAATIYSNCSIT